MERARETGRTNNPENSHNPSSMIGALGGNPHNSSPEASTPAERVQAFRKLSKDAVSATYTAIASDNDQQKQLALVQYNQAMGRLDHAISCAKSWEFPENDKQEVAFTRVKLEQQRDNVFDRMKQLQLESGAPDSIGYLLGPPDDPPSMYRANGGPSSMPHRSMSDPQVSFGPVEVTEDPSLANGSEVFAIPNNIQIYYISHSDHNVDAPSYPSFLRIVVMNAPDEVEEATEEPTARAPRRPSPPAFLQVGDWSYPLVPGQSPVYKASFGSYIFPDLSREGSSIGLVFPPEVTETQRATFDEILLQLLGLTQFPTSTTLDKIEPITVVEPSHPVFVPGGLPAEDEVGIDTPASRSRAEAIAQSIVYGAQKTSEYISAGANFVVDRMHPVQTEPVIKPELKKGVKTAKHVSGKAVRVSGYLVSQLGRGTLALGRTLAPYIQSTTARLYAKTTEKSDEEARKAVDGACEVTSAVIVGLSTIYVGLEDAARIMAKSIGENTVRIVDKRYGQHASALASDTVETFGNAAMAGYNVHCLAPKAVAKRIIKDTGKTAVMSRNGESSSAPIPPPRSVSTPAISSINKDNKEPGSSPRGNAPPRPPPPKKH